MEKIIGIYKIINKLNNRFYIGSSINITARFYSHRVQLRKNAHGNPFLQNDWNKCGENNFEFIIYEICNKEFLYIKEQEYIDLYFDNQKKCYNICPKVMIPPNQLGKKLTEEHKKKISIGFNEESRQKLREFHTGKVLSLETKGKISKTMKGVPKSIETKKNMSIAQRGKIKSPDHIKKIADARRGKPVNMSPEGRERKRQSVIKRCQKTYNIILVSPNDTIYGPITNLSQFAKEHQLEISLLHNVITGKRNFHKGWHLQENNVIIQKYKGTLLRNPIGIIIELTESVAIFAKQWNLNEGNLRKLLRGAAKTHKGWSLPTTKTKHQNVCLEDPNGIKYNNVINLKKGRQEHNLGTNFYNFLNGKRKNCKGWKLIE